MSLFRTFLIVSVVAVVLDGKGMDDVMYKTNRPYFYAGAALKNLPVQVYAPIAPDQISCFTNAYYETWFDYLGRVVLLRKLLRGSEIDVTTYSYHEAGTVKEEYWSDQKHEVVRTFNAKGKLIGFVVKTNAAISVSAPALPP